MGRYYFWLRLKAALCLCGGFCRRIITTETQRTPRLHRELLQIRIRPISDVKTKIEDRENEQLDCSLSRS